MNLRNLIYFFAVLILPFLELITPSWLKIGGMAPLWSVLLLLPIAIESGSLIGVIIGFYFGLILDGMSLGGPSHLPALVILGFLWGRLSEKDEPIDLILNLGLLAWIGALIFGFSLWIQNIFFHNLISFSLFNSWALYTLLAQAIITALLAPIVCSWVLLLLRKSKIRPKTWKN